MLPQSKFTRLTDQQMEQLITTIRRQASKMRVNITQSAKEVRLRQRGSSMNIQQARTPGTVSPNLERSDSSYPNTLIENLVVDNKMLYSDIQDFEQTLHIIVARYRELKRELMNEKANTSIHEFLETQLSSLRQQNKQITEANLRLKEQYMSLMEMLRETVNELADEQLSDSQLQEQLEKENKYLREAIGVTVLTEDVKKQIDLELTQQESFVMETQSQHQVSRIREFLKSKQAPIEQQNQKKGYLLGKPPVNKPGGMASFFNNYEKKS